MRKKSVWIGMLLFLVPIVWSIGMEGPMLSPLLFEPGKEVVVGYCVNNYNYDVAVKAGGDFSEFVSLSEIVEEDGKQCFTMMINFPEEIPNAGEYYIIISAAEIGSTKGAVGSLTSITRNIKVVVYAQEKDIMVSFGAPNANENEKMTLNIGVQSWCYQDINKVKGKINIYNEKNMSVSYIETNEKQLKSKESATLTAEFDNTGLKQGDYWAEAKVEFDGKEKRAESDFKIGALDLSVLNYTTEVTTGEINPFSVKVKSNWNKPIKELIMVLEIEGEKAMQTATTSLEAWGETELSGYWRVFLKTGEYVGKLKFYLDGEEEIEEIKVVVKEKAKLEKPDSFFSITTLILMGLIILLIILLLMVYWQRLKKK